MLKKNSLRHNEYYDMQPIFDNLYKQSQQNSKFTHLYDMIVKDENILLAFRNIKRNSGSKTAGTNGKTIKYWENKPIEDFLKYIKNRFANYQPQKVKRVEIPKSNGQKRPLGIPNIEDRIIQQCIKQILEPICEAKFHPHSYGFRPNRGTENAVAYTMRKINIEKRYFMVDIDIKGFFDNVNHSKLIKQMWALGIRDKRLICIISKMLKAEIDGIGIPDKGVPQGGILSPLLSNIVLNELDWWISDQWETYETYHTYNKRSDKFKHLKEKSNLKEIYIVRYADDFKIFCREYKTADKIFHATRQWLKDRLKLDISLEKSKIVDVRKTSSEFLGFKLKAKRKSNKWIVKSHMSDKAIENAKNTLKEQIKYVQKHPIDKSLYIYNRLVVGLQNYYKIATEVNRDFSVIEYKLSRCLKSRFKRLRTRNGNKSEEYIKRYGKSKYNIFVMKTALYPIHYVQTKPPMLCSQQVTNYTKDGRQTLHTKLGFINRDIMKYLSKNPVLNKSVEYNDNRLSLYSAQKGKCAITGYALGFDIEMHHITPVSQGGSDRYRNLVLLTHEAHILIHAIEIDTFTKYANSVGLTIKMLEKVNKYRRIIGNYTINRNN